MTDSSTPIDPLARLRELNERRHRIERETREAGYRRRLVKAAGIDPNDLSEQGRRILNWLTGWDEWTVGGLEEILIAARESSRELRRPSRSVGREGLGL